MKPDIAMQRRAANDRDRDLARHAQRVVPVAVFFALAFAMDMLTAQRASAIWGSAAIIASIIHVFPTIRFALAALGGYAAIWVAFNLVRAVSDDAGIGLVSMTTVAGWERSLFGGTLPSAVLQSWWFTPGASGPHDILMALVHISFFLVPTSVAFLTWWKRRPLFAPYAAATAISFLLGLAGFLLLPTAPPWMSDPDDVTRITRVFLADTLGLSVGAGSGPAFGFEPNHLAAMPSVHVAATVLVFLLARRVGRPWAFIAGAYAVAMSFSVVYLGEHFVLDAVLGWAVALIGWQVAWRWVPARGSSRA